MTFPKARLVVSACLFLSWIGFLLYLVIITPTTILSKPQFLLASLYVVAEIRAEQGRPNSRVTITEVLWSADPADRELAGRQINLPELSAYQKQQGYERPGKYLLPLLKLGNGTQADYLIAPVPRTEGYVQPTMLGTVEVFGMREKDYPHLAASTLGLSATSCGRGPLSAAFTLLARNEIKREKVSHGLNEMGARPQDVEALAGRLAHLRFAPVVAVRRLPVRKADQLVRELQELGVEARFVKEDVRIYPWLPETRSQVEAMVKAKR